MNEPMQTEVLGIIVEAFRKYINEKELSHFIKRECDKKFLASWHCIVGRNFGSYVTHEEGSYLYVRKG